MNSQRREKAAEPNPWRDIYLLVGLSRQYTGILYRRADVASSAQVQLLFHGP
jgi:hypothetical protein